MAACKGARDNRINLSSLNQLKTERATIMVTVLGGLLVHLLSDKNNWKCLS